MASDRLNRMIIACRDGYLVRCLRCGRWVSRGLAVADPHCDECRSVSEIGDGRPRPMDREEARTANLCDGFMDVARRLHPGERAWIDFDHDRIVVAGVPDADR